MIYHFLEIVVKPSLITTLFFVFTKCFSWWYLVSVKILFFTRFNQSSNNVSVSLVQTCQPSSNLQAQPHLNCQLRLLLCMCCACMCGCVIEYLLYINHLQASNHKTFLTSILGQLICPTSINNRVSDWFLNILFYGLWNKKSINPTFLPQKF